MTLIELIVALTLLALVTAMLFGSLRVGGSALSAVTSSSRSMDQTVFAQIFLRQQLAQAVFVSAATDTSDPDSTSMSAARFEGGESRLTFTAPWLSYIGQGAMFDFSVFEENGDLILSWRPTNRNIDVALAEANEFIGRRALATGIRNARIRYYGESDTREGMRWQAVWHHRSRLPQLLSVEVDYADGNARWPKLLVMLAS